jgi:Flp pilus assembly protein TadG
LRSGFVAVKVALCMTIIVGVVALNLDGGRMMDERRVAQASADAAALAAAAQLYEAYWTDGGTDTSGAARTAALQNASSNGFSSSQVTVNIPPVAGTFAGQAGYVEVIVQTTLSASFGQIFTGSGMVVTARSVARGQPLAIGIIALSNSGAGAFKNSSLAFAVINKPVIVNSSDPSAFEEIGLGAFIAGRVDITGGMLNLGGLILLTQVNTGVARTIDPLAFLPVPSTSGASVQSSVPLTVNSLLPVILQPGVYQGGIHVTNASTVLMMPGVYIMQGGGFKVDNLASVVGLSTMVYNTTSTTYASGPISVGGLGKLVMTAPLSGTYQGINFFQDRSLTQPISITGLGLTTITGVIYAAQAAANITGSAAVDLDILGGAYVVNTLNVGGVGFVTINLGLNPPRVPDVRVVE